MTSKTVFLIEPDEKLRLVLSLVLEDQGLKVISSRTVFDAIEILNQFPVCDYLLHHDKHETESLPFFMRCDRLSLPRPKLLEDLNLASSEFPDLHSLRRSFRQTI